MILQIKIFFESRMSDQIIKTWKKHCWVHLVSYFFSGIQFSFEAADDVIFVSVEDIANVDEWLLRNMKVATWTRANSVASSVLSYRLTDKWITRTRTRARSHAHGERAQPGAERLRADVVGQGVPLGAARQHHLPLGQLAVQPRERPLPREPRNLGLDTGRVAHHDAGEIFVSGSVSRFCRSFSIVTNPEFCFIQISI